MYVICMYGVDEDGIKADKFLVKLYIPYQASELYKDYAIQMAKKLNEPVKRIIVYSGSECRENQMVAERGWAEDDWVHYDGYDDEEEYWD